MGCKTLSEVLSGDDLTGDALRVLLVLANNANDYSYEGSITLANLSNGSGRIEKDELENILKGMEEYGCFDFINFARDDNDNSDEGIIDYRLNIITRRDVEDSERIQELNELKTEVYGLRTTGYVYLLQAGPYYKIGKANSLERRLDQLAIQLPHKPELLHSIASKTPLALEQHFHQRFSAKRLNGEWFALDDDEIAEFSAFTRIDLKIKPKPLRAITVGSNGYDETVVIEEHIKPHAENIVSMIIKCAATKAIGWILEQHCHLTVTDDTIEVVFHGHHRMARELLYEDETIRTLHGIVNQVCGREMDVRVIDAPVENP